MTSRTSKALERLFAKHRIVFWYDDKQELREDFEGFELDGVKKIELQNNEFTVKHRLLRQEPKTNFLIYKEGKQPEPVKNWLYDVELAHTVFKTDQTAIWLSELELPSEFSEIVEQHCIFLRQTLKLRMLETKRNSERTRQKNCLKLTIP